MSSTTSSYSIRALLLSIALAGCGNAPDDLTEDLRIDNPAEAERQLSPQVMGGQYYSNDCSVAKQNWINDAARQARIAASSNMFAQCLYTTTVRGIPFTFSSSGYTVHPYYKCAGDPNVSNAYDAAVSVARGYNEFSISCNGVEGNASTGQNDGLNHNNDETLAFSSWLDSVHTSGNIDLLEQTSGILWHEAVHTHDFGHGSNGDNDTAYTACGITAIPKCSTYGESGCWHFQQNTMPYIIQGCLVGTLYSSRLFCSSTTCGGNAKPILYNLDESYPQYPFGCECIEDPDVFGRPDSMLVRTSGGATQAGGLLENSTHVHLLPTGSVNPETYWTHGAALNRNYRLLYNINSGRADIINAQGLYTANTHWFSLGWTHIVSLPNEMVFLVNSTASTPIWAVGRVTPAGVWQDVRWGYLSRRPLHVTAAGYNQVLLIDWDGVGEVGRISSTGQYAPFTTINGFGAWTNVVSVGEDRYILFYHRNTGAAAIGRVSAAGTFRHMYSVGASSGWTSVSTTFDGRVMWYNKSANLMGVSRVRPDGVIADLWFGAAASTSSFPGVQFDILLTNGNVSR